MATNRDITYNLDAWHFNHQSWIRMAIMSSQFSFKVTHMLNELQTNVKSGNNYAHEWNYSQTMRSIGHCNGFENKHC